MNNEGKKMFYGLKNLIQPSTDMTLNISNEKTLIFERTVLLMKHSCLSKPSLKCIAYTQGGKTL